jgi:uncharacterized membrane protein
MIWGFLLTALGWLLFVIVLLIILLVLSLSVYTVTYTVRSVKDARHKPRSTTIFKGKE